MRFPVRTFFLASGLAIAAATAAATAIAQEIVQIGLVGPLTGPQAAIGKDNISGAKIAIDELNQKKIVIGGKPVIFQLAPEDDQANPKIATLVTQKLIDAKVKTILGPYNSDATLAVSRIVNDAGIVMLTVGTNPRITQQGYQFVFRLGPNDNQLGGDMAIYAAKQLKLKKVFVIDDRTVYGQGVADAFVAAAKAGKIDVVGRKSGIEKENAFGPILNAIKGRPVDGVFYGGYYAQAAALKQQMKLMNIDAALMGGDGLCNTETGKLAGTIINDKTYCAQGGASLGARASEKIFLAEFKKRYDKLPLTFAPYFYDGVKMIAMAMQKAGSSEPSRFAPVLAAMRYAGVVGDYEFDAARDSKNSPVTIYQFKNGEPVAVQTN